MNIKDKEDIRELIKNLIQIQNENIFGKFELIKQELNYIKEQTTKTNGRVTNLESEMKDYELHKNDHLHNCPNNSKILKLEQFQQKYTITKNNFYTTITGAVVLSTLIIQVLNLIF